MRLFAALFSAALVCTLGFAAPVRAWQQPQPAAAAQKLTLQEAERIALQNHPRIQAAVQLAAAANARVTQARSAYYPEAHGSLSGAEAQGNTRIAAGYLNSPSVFDKYANGAVLSWLITDFGRTHELVKSAHYGAQAQQQDVVATRADVLLRVDQAYYGVLRAEAVLEVAQTTVKERQLVADQVSVLAKNKIKSGLDVSFAQVDLSQANLLLIQAQNDLQASFAALSAALGYSDQRTFDLAEQPLPAAPSRNFPALLQTAFLNRPELAGQRLAVSSAQSYATAERDLRLPAISAVGAAGLTPVRDVSETQLAPRYAAAGFNVNVPIFNGRLFGALHAEAAANARAQQQYLRDLQDRVARDVRQAWLNANSAYQRLAVTQQLLDSANQAVDLARSRYQLGLSSIVELSQAQLNQTQAQIQQASAKYDFEQQVSALNYQLGLLR